MKKIAILFFGQPRQLEKGSEFIKPFFDFSSQGIETDYFFHSWTLVDPKHINRTYEVGHEEQEILQVQGLTERIINLYNPVSVQIDDPINDENFTIEAQKFVNLWESIGKTESFLKSKPAHAFLSNNSRVKYKIGQLISSEKVIQSKIDHEKKYNFEYDFVFRIRTDLAYKPSLLEHRLKYIENGLNMLAHAEGDANQVYVDFLKISNGQPLCGDQNIWGESKAMNTLFIDCTKSFLRYVNKFLNRCTQGYYNNHESIVCKFLHIEIAIAIAAMDHNCSIFQIPRGPIGAGSHCLIRDTVGHSDDYETIHQKHCDFFKK